jgi:hypothetical protein
MTLPNDIARCPGVGSDEEGWREGCEDCARRISGLTGTDSITPWMQPPEVMCEFRIEQEED